jgi:hypothetical protein
MGTPDTAYVNQNVTNARVPSDVRNVVEITLRVRFVIVDRWREHLILKDKA